MGGWGTAIGNNSYANGDGGSAIAIGADAYAQSQAGGGGLNNNGAVAIGEKARAIKSSIAIGFNAQATQNAAIALG